MSKCSEAPQDLAALLSLASDFRWEMDGTLRFSAVSGPLIDGGQLVPDTVLGKALGEWEASLLRSTGHPAEPMVRLAQHQPFRDIECAITLRHGDSHWFALSGLPRVDEGGRFCGYQGVARDITARLKEEARYRQLAYHDALTGLPNRRLFNDRAEQVINQSRRLGVRCALMLIDLDQFKHINDQYGHAAGDRMLIEIATQLRGTVRLSDTVARLGGDEFVVLLPRVGNASDALIVARKMLDALGDTRPHAVRASIGVALFPDHGFDLHALLMQADQAMYAAKRGGGCAAHLATAVAGEQLR